MVAAASMTVSSYRRKVQGKEQGGEKSSETRWPAKRRAAPKMGSTLPSTGRLEKYVWFVAVTLGGQVRGEHTEGGAEGDGLGLGVREGVGVGLALQAEPPPSRRSDGQHWPARDGLSASTFSGSTPGAPSCTDSGVSYTLVGVSTPAPHGVDMRQMRSAEALMTSACRHGAPPLQAGARPSVLGSPTSGPGSM